MNLSLSTEALWSNVGKRGRSDFLVTPDLRLSYQDLSHLVHRWLAFFDAQSITPQQRIVFRTSNEIAAITGFLAALLDDVIPVLLTPDTSETRLNSLIHTVEPAGLVTDDESEPVPPRAGMAILKIGTGPVYSKRGLFTRPSAVDFVPGMPEEVASRSPRQPQDPHGLAYVLFTSGTTSAPTGVQITRQNLFSNLATETRVFGYDCRSRIFNDMILAHADGMIQGPVQALAVGGAVIRSGGFSLAKLEYWLERVRSERATHVITVPTVWAMIERYARHDDYFDNPECKALLSVAAKLPDGLWQGLEQRFRRPVFNQYGLTETVVTALWAGPHEEMGAFGTIGKPIDCEAKISSVSTDGSGELLLRGLNIFPGYWRDPQRTRESFTSDAWLRTGDLARCREDGSFEILGRLKSVIMMGGFLIRPDEIDEALLRHPAIRESVTLAFDDEMFGEVPVAAVVADDPETQEADLIEHARGYLETQKIPKRIILVDAIPRGPSGKPQLDVLRGLVGASMDEGRDPMLGASGQSIADAVFDVAADVFRIDRTALNGNSGPDSVAGWDSFSHLNFIMAAEQRFDVSFPAARVATITNIRDMIRAITDLRA